MADLPWHFLDLGILALQVGSKGAGIRVALFDTGVAASSGMFSSMRSVTPDGADAEDLDDDGHGTACASLIASLDENTPGIAPDVELISINVTAGGSPIEGLVRRALDTASRLDCHVVSCSFTLLQAEATTLDAIRALCNRGIVVVAASGNDPSVASAFPERTPNVLVVGPYGHDQEPLESRFGLFTDVLAPGIDLPVTARDGSRTLFGESSGAAAVTAGVVALVLSATRDQGAAHVGVAIEALARSTATLSGTARLIDTDRLLRAAQALP